jgi:sugar O-acyltransferase (sialic acid O-acetyltransferase NeuD family)
VETNPIILLGGGGHARVVLDCLLQSGKHVSAIFDDKVLSGTLMGVAYVGPYRADAQRFARAIVAMGDNYARKRAAEACRHEFASVHHSSAMISAKAKLGTGCMVLHGAIVQVNSSIGNHVILNTGSQVDHDCNIGDFVHIAPGAVLCGSVSVGEGTLIGAGAVILPGIRIGAWSTVGAGAVVRTDVPDRTVVVGNPAREIKP